MTRNPNLVPTAIVDKRGRLTTVHRKPSEGPASASKVIPAPVTQASSAKQREKLESEVVGIFPDKYKKHVKARLNGLSDASVTVIGECAQKITEKPNMNADLGTFAQMVSEARILSYPEAVYPYLLKSMDRISDELAIFSLMHIYQKALSKDKTPASDEILNAHVDAASKYYELAINAEHEMSYKYTSNQPLFDFVAKHPGKVDLIIQHYLTYLPEKNGYEDFERDLDKLGELSKPIGEGWL